MCQGHGQHRCLALNPCHKQNTGRDSAVPRPLTCVQSSAPRGARVGARQLTVLSQMPSDEAGRGREKRGTASPHGAATLVADTGSATWS